MEKHGTVRGLILPSIVEYLSKEFSWDENEALEQFYTSGVGAAFADDESGLYGQSPLYISALFIEEYKEKQVGEKEKNESIDSALKRFRRETSKVGIIPGIRKHRYYKKHSVKRKRKSEAARKKRRKQF